MSPKMFISSGISILILSLVLYGSNALKLTSEKVTTVCNADKLAYSFVKNLTANGSLVSSSIHIGMEAEKKAIIVKRFCLNKASSLNKLRGSLPLAVFNSISSLAGCVNVTNAILTSDCARFQGAYGLLNSLSGETLKYATQIIEELVALDVSLYDSVLTPKINSLPTTLADQNQETVNGIITNCNIIHKTYISLL